MMKKLIVFFLGMYQLIGTSEATAQTDLDYYKQAYSIILESKDTLKHLLPDTMLFNPDRVSICVSEISYLFTFLAFQKLVVEELYPDSSNSFKDSLVNLYYHLDTLRMAEVLKNDSGFEINRNLNNIIDFKNCDCSYLVFFSNISEEKFFSAEIFYLSPGTTVQELEVATISYFNLQDWFYFIFVIEEGIVRKIFSAMLIS